MLTLAQSVRSLVSLPYEDWYLSAPPILRPFVALGILILLAFLFSFIGISASDFFCPNLSTIASYLGLSESTAGVTFLAFGNGSPDVFSTFAALNNDSFGLAIGELIGAASFSEWTTSHPHEHPHPHPHSHPHPQPHPSSFASSALGPRSSPEPTDRSTSLNPQSSPSWSVLLL